MSVLRYWRSKPGVFRHGDHYVLSGPALADGRVPVVCRRTFRGVWPEDGFRCVLDDTAGGFWPADGPFQLHPDGTRHYHDDDGPSPGGWWWTLASLKAA